MNKNECILKDLLLTHLHDAKGGSSTSSDLTSDIGYQHFEVSFALEELCSDNLVELQEIYNKDSVAKGYMVNLTNKGYYYLRFHQSFINQYKTGITKRNWMIAKTIANTLNAAAIIFIAIIGLILNYSNLEYKQANSELNKKINELELHINGINEHSLNDKHDSTITQVN